jgi:hypothetical protein
VDHAKKELLDHIYFVTDDIKNDCKLAISGAVESINVSFQERTEKIERVYQESQIVMTQISAKLNETFEEIKNKDKSEDYETKSVNIDATIVNQLNKIVTKITEATEINEKSNLETVAKIEKSNQDTIELLKQTIVEDTETKLKENLEKTESKVDHAVELLNSKMSEIQFKLEIDRLKTDMKAETKKANTAKKEETTHLRLISLGRKTSDLEDKLINFEKEKDVEVKSLRKEVKDLKTKLAQQNEVFEKKINENLEKIFQTKLHDFLLKVGNKSRN